MTQSAGLAQTPDGLNMASPDRGRVIGYLAMSVTVLVWAAFAVSARATNESALAFGDVALIRSLIPALVFLPFVPSRIAMIRRAGLATCTAIAIGAGLPFFWLAVTGGALTSAAHVSALIAGTVPAFVAGLTWGLTGRTPSRLTLLAVAMILLGALMMIRSAGTDVALAGAGVLLLAAVFWTAFTTAVKHSGLDPIGCAIVISLPSAVAIIALMSTGAISSNWGQFGMAQALPFVLVQGFGVSVVAILTYAFAIARLGSARCAAMGSMAPALTAVMGIVFLNEPLQTTTAIAVVTICAGVYLSTRTRD